MSLAPPPVFRVASSYDAGRALTTIAVTGEIDYATASEAVDALERCWSPASGDHLFIDLTGVTFFSSAAISFLIHAHATALTSGHAAVVITGGNHCVTRPLEIAGLSSAIPTFACHADAAAAIGLKPFSSGPR